MKRRGSYDDTDGKDKPVRKSGAVGADFDAQFRGYVNLNLTDEQKVIFEKWSASEALWETLAFQVADGVNLALRYEPKSEGFLASGTQRRGASPNAGLCVTARGREPWIAFARLLYCLAVLSRKERWEDTQPLANPDRW